MECGICCEQVSRHSGSRPKILNCGHSYCEGCVENLKEGPVVRCPLCRGISSITQIRTNFALIRVLEDLANDREKWCEDAQKQSTRDHAAIRKCLTHSAAVDVYCLQCNKAICPRCHATRRSMCGLHERITLREAAQLAKTESRRCHSALLEKLTQVEGMKRELQEAHNKYIRVYETAAQEALKRFDVLFEELKVRREMVVRLLEQKAEHSRGVWQEKAGRLNAAEKILSEQVSVLSRESVPRDVSSSLQCSSSTSSSSSSAASVNSLSPSRMSRGQASHTCYANLEGNPLNTVNVTNNQHLRLSANVRQPDTSLSSDTRTLSSGSMSRPVGVHSPQGRVAPPAAAATSSAHATDDHSSGQQSRVSFPFGNSVVNDSQPSPVRRDGGLFSESEVPNAYSEMLCALEALGSGSTSADQPAALLNHGSFDAAAAANEEDSSCSPEDLEVLDHLIPLRLAVGRAMEKVASLTSFFNGNRADSQGPDLRVGEKSMSEVGEVSRSCRKFPTVIMEVPVLLHGAAGLPENLVKLTFTKLDVLAKTDCGVGTHLSSGGIDSDVDSSFSQDPASLDGTGLVDDLARLTTEDDPQRFSYCGSNASIGGTGAHCTSGGMGARVLTGSLCRGSPGGDGAKRRVFEVSGGLPRQVGGPFCSLGGMIRQSNDFHQSFSAPETAAQDFSVFHPTILGFRSPASRRQHLGGRNNRTLGSPTCWSSHHTGGRVT